MQKITYSERIQLKNKINELQMINIDDKLDQNFDSGVLKITGKIQINGQATTDAETETFNHEVEVDISIDKEQLIEERATVAIEDFDYSIEDSYIIINLIMKIEGLKEIEPYFPPQDDKEIIEIENEEDIKIERQQTYTELETNEDINPQDEAIFEGEKIDIPPKQSFSLLSQIFKNKTIKKETSYNFHVVKTDTNYQELATLYNVDLESLKSANNNEEIYVGKLILIPKK